MSGSEEVKRIGEGTARSMQVDSDRTSGKRENNNGEEDINDVTNIGYLSCGRQRVNVGNEQTRVRALLIYEPNEDEWRRLRRAERRRRWIRRRKMRAVIFQIDDTSSIDKGKAKAVVLTSSDSDSSSSSGFKRFRQEWENEKVVAETSKWQNIQELEWPSKEDNLVKEDSKQEAVKGEEENDLCYEVDTEAYTLWRIGKKKPAGSDGDSYSSKLRRLMLSLDSGREIDETLEGLRRRRAAVLVVRDTDSPEHMDNDSVEALGFQEVVPQQHPQEP